MKAVTAREVRPLKAGGALAHRDVVCAWCRQTITRKPIGGARLSHTICAPCIQRFLAEPDSPLGLA